MLALNQTGSLPVSSCCCSAAMDLLTSTNTWLGYKVFSILHSVIDREASFLSNILAGDLVDALVITLTDDEGPFLHVVITVITADEGPRTETFFSPPARISFSKLYHLVTNHGPPDNMNIFNQPPLVKYIHIIRRTVT